MVNLRCSKNKEIIDETKLNIQEILIIFEESL